MLTAIPRHFEANGHLTVRELLKRQAEQQAEQWRETHTFWKNILTDPASSPEERSQAETVLADLYHSPERPTDELEA